MSRNFLFLHRFSICFFLVVLQYYYKVDQLSSREQYVLFQERCVESTDSGGYAKGDVTASGTKALD